MATDLLKAQQSFSAPSSAFFSPTAKQLAHKHLNISFKGRICQLAQEVILKLYTDQNETKEKADGGNSILAFVTNLGFCTLQTFNKIIIFCSSLTLFPRKVTGRVLEPIPTAHRRRQGASMDGSSRGPIRAFEVRNLAQGNQGSVLKACWHLPCYLLPFCLQQGSNRGPCVSDVS